jgi:hypothetical protein
VTSRWVSGHGPCRLVSMQQTTTSPSDAEARESATLQQHQQWRYSVAHLADMVRLHEALLRLPPGGSPRSRRTALAELERCIAQAHRDLEDLSQTVGTKVPAELTRPDDFRGAAQAPTLTHEEEGEFESALAALGYEPSKFVAQLTDRGWVVVAAPKGRVLYDRQGWLPKFAAHLKQGLFGAP